MEIKVGEYVRTKYGEIGIITQVYPQIKWIKKVNPSLLDYNIIKKHSSNIIDLIEANDYVNGSRVFSISDGIVKTFNLDYVEDEIKLIVTHEQFKSIEYTIHEREEKENE